MIADPTPQIVADALTSARALIAAGHCKGVARQILPRGKRLYCLAGAIGETTGSVTDGDRHYPGIRIYASAKVAVLDQLPAPFTSIPQFNDAPATTPEMVCDVLQRATAAVLASGSDQ